MRGYLIDVQNDEHRVVEIANKDRLGQFYELIGCECIDIATRKIGGKYFDVIVDDEGLLVANPICSAYDSRHRPMLAGNLIILGEADEEGNLTSLSVHDVQMVKEAIRYTIDLHRGAMHPVVIMDY